MKLIIPVVLAGLVLTMLAFSGCTGSSESNSATMGDETKGGTVTIIDGFDRTVTVPASVDRVVCSGSGCLRYLVYLEGENLAIGVDDIETKGQVIEGRPYYLVYGEQFKTLPLIGEFRGKDDPEKIIAINPQVIFKTGSTGTSYGTDAGEANELEEKTGIPVVAFPYGSLRDEAEKADMYNGLRVMGEVIGKEDRAEEVIAYIDSTMADLQKRMADIPADEKKTVYIGGVSSAGAHGIISTEPAYPPFLWVNADNVASGLGTAHADVAKEALVGWDPEYIFVDLGTLSLEGGGAIGELKMDPALQGLSASADGHVYGVLPYNFYNINYGTVLANAYFIGKVIYPDEFADVDPKEKADEIYSFFVGKPVFSEMDAQYGGMAYKEIPLS